MNNFKVGDVGRLDDNSRSVVYLGPHPTKEHYYLFEYQDEERVVTMFRDDFVFHQRNFEFEDLNTGDLLDDGLHQYVVAYIDMYRALIIRGDYYKILEPNSYQLNCYQRVRT